MARRIGVGAVAGITATLALEAIRITSFRLGGRRIGWALGYGLLVGAGFLASPAVKAMGVGFFASRMPAMQLTVAAAHLAFGAVLGILVRRWLSESPPVPDPRHL